MIAPDSNDGATSGNARAVLWAKFDPETLDWYPLEGHLRDTAEVARWMWSRWVPAATRDVLVRDLGDAGLAEKVAVFVAGAHDVGKASAAFATQVPAMEGRVRDAGLPVPRYGRQRRHVPHGMAGAVSFRAHARRRWGWKNRRSCGDGLAAVIGGHHGTYPTGDEMTACEGMLGWERDGAAGDGPRWEDFREGLWERTAEQAGLSVEDLRTLGETRLSTPAQVMLTGFVIVCDWIASNRDLFPFGDGIGDGSADPDRTRRALARLALPGPWAPRPPADAKDIFDDRFSLPAGATPRPVQRAAVELAEAAGEAPLLLIEAPTGEGKTEAALAAAEILAARFGAGGVTVGLPTCATSDGMFPRILDWLDRAAGGRASAALCHSKAQFNEDYRDLFGGAGARVTGIASEGIEHPDVEAHWWLRGRKKAALADFTVGTIDQVLFTALSSRHVMLRHLGLAGKVVILDEVHAADEYMAVYLDRALEWLGALRVPVIALSATLPPARRGELLTAYRRGRAIYGGPDKDPCVPGEVIDDGAYPLLVMTGADGVRTRHPEPSGRRSETTVEVIGEDPADLVERILAESAGGGCVAVVRNTVSRAQDTYRMLRERLGGDAGEVVLMHSRFMGLDRRRRERELLELLGPDGRRPRRLIVVATQVIEQSLDVDFDLMISDLAPMDLLIQRIGRLHRHPGRTRPTGMAGPRLLLTGVTGDATGEPPEFPRGCEMVYGRALLLRTMAALRAHHRRDASGAPVIASPDDVAGLVRSTYDPEAPIPDGWTRAWSTAEAERQEAIQGRVNKAKNFLLPAPAARGAVWGWNAREIPEEVQGQAQVRDIAESLEVVLVARRGGQLFALDSVPGRGGEPVDMLGGIDEELAMMVARCTVGIPGYCLRGDAMDALIAELEGYGQEAWQDTHWLRRMLPLPLDEEGKHVSEHWIFAYDPDTGLTVTPRKGS